TKEQFDTRTRERFARFDKNGDSVIDQAEMEAVLKDGMSRRFDRRGRGKGMLDQRSLRAFDANRDGKVTPEEMRAEYERRFTEADRNASGKIGAAALPRAGRGHDARNEGPGGTSRGGRHRMTRGRGFLRQADANPDGVATREEVAALADREF